MSESEIPFEREQEQAAAAEAASIGGQVSEPPTQDGEELDPAQRPLAESGEGESEGFEQAEEELIDHATHGDQHAARRISQDAFSEADDGRAAEAGEPDLEQDPDA